VFPKLPYVFGHLGILKQGKVQRGIGTWSFGRGLGVGFWPSNSSFFPKLPSPLPPPPKIRCAFQKETQKDPHNKKIQKIIAYLE
jgi:hypothetical protein